MWYKSIIILINYPNNHRCDKINARTVGANLFACSTNMAAEAAPTVLGLRAKSALEIWWCIQQGINQHGWTKLYRHSHNQISVDFDDENSLKRHDYAGYFQKKMPEKYLYHENVRD